MLFTVYKITNKLNNKFYIGMHQTTNINDGYMGSGKRLHAAYKKYGIENFEKEILHIFDNEQDMKNKEKELVVISEMSYNLCDGGKGGFGYINRTGKALRTGAVLSEKTRQKISKSKLGFKHSDETKKKISENSVNHRLDVRKKISENLKGKPKSEEHKRKISEAIKRKHNESAGIV
jgi:hypothetical protein